MAVNPPMSNNAARAVRYSSQGKSLIRSFFPCTQRDDDVRNQYYPGTGTNDDPFIINYLHNDPQDAMNLPETRKWTIAILHALSTFAVTFASSVYVSGIPSVMHRFNVSNEVATLGLALYVLGFAVGPLIWAPLSEVHGRQPIYIISFTAYVAFSVAAACSPNIASLLVLRLFACAFGASTMTNSGAIIIDMFRKEERGLATSMFATAPFLGPAFGPVAGGFLAETQGWRWPLGLAAIVGGVVWIPAMLVTPETYAPVILQKRATALSRMTDRVYISQLDVGKPPRKLLRELSISLTRPWILLFLEPIVLLASLYISIIYGTLYMLLAGIPIVFEGTRGWSPGIAGLPFVGVTIGVCLATVACGMDNKRYSTLSMNAKTEDRAVEPEARLGAAMVGSIVLPIGLFLFAWTAYPSVHWIAPIIGATLFACGLVMVFISLTIYLIDSYIIYAASVLAANSILRSFFGTAFPLFTTQMYASLGDEWASSIPAFLALACVPVPFLFCKYGPQIRSKCKYSAEAARLLEMIQRREISVAVGQINESKKEVAQLI